MFDIDKEFGSIGSIYDIDISNPIDGVKLNRIGWIIHPPYVAQSILDAFQKIHDGLENAQLNGIDMFVIFIVPYWPDSDVYRKIKRTHFDHIEIIMTRHTHFYENHGRFINSSFDTSLFIFDDNSDICKYHDIISSIYIKNIPNKNNIPRSLKLLMANIDHQQIKITDKDDDTNIVTLSSDTNNRMMWKSQYNRDNDSYVVRRKDISPLIVKIT